MALASKVRAFAHHPWHSLRWRLLHYGLEVPARARLARCGILDELNRFIRARPCHAEPQGYADLWALYRMARRHSPLVVWEFGSGQSTLVLARALRDNGAGYLYSMDAAKEWAESTAEAMPESLRPFCQVLHSPVEEVTIHGIPGFRHTVLPDRMPTLVYLDGPALTAERQVAVDMLDIEPRLSPGFVLVIDDRKANTHFLREHLTRNYAFARRPYRAQPVFRLLG